MGATAFDEEHWWLSPRAFHVFRLFAFNTVWDIIYVMLRFVDGNTTFRIVLVIGELIFNCLSHALIMWRFFEIKTSAASYFKLFKLDKREERCQIALSILMIIEGVAYTLYAKFAPISEAGLFYIDENLTVSMITISLTFTILFVIMKLKYASVFSSRSLQYAAFFTSIDFINDIFTLVDTVLLMYDIEVNLRKWSAFILGCISCYAGIYILLLRGIEDKVKFYTLKYWTVPPAMKDIKESDITTEEYWDKVMREESFAAMPGQTKLLKKMNTKVGKAIGKIEQGIGGKQSDPDENQNPPESPLVDKPKNHNG